MIDWTLMKMCYVHEYEYIRSTPETVYFRRFLRAGRTSPSQPE